MVGVRSKDHGDKRQLILKVAAELFGQQGFNKTSISEISKACNASKAWIYHYFLSKEDILFALLLDFLTAAKERLDRASSVNGDARERLRAFVSECLKIYDDYRINYPILFNEMIFLRDDQQKVLRVLEDHSVRRLEAILVELRPDLARERRMRTPVTLLVFGTINWTYTWYNPDGMLSIDAIADLIVGFALGGVAGVPLNLEPEGPA
jgi:AcrR family transcriptional regulator